MLTDDATRARIVPARNPVLRATPYGGMLFNGGGRPVDPRVPIRTLCAVMGGHHTPVVETGGDWLARYHRHLLAGGSPARADDVPGTLRRLTLAEAVVLQGFDPAFPFQGSVSDRFAQVGNSVPPPLARAIVAKLVAP